MPSLAPLAVAAAALFAVAHAANCTTTEVAAIAKLDSVIENAPECARLNSLVAGEATLLQICSDSACIALVKKAATQAPDCLVNGESAKRVSLTAFTSCATPDPSTSNSTTLAPTPTPTPVATTKAPSTGSVAGDSDSKSSATVKTPAPTTAAPKSGAAATATSTVAVTSAAAVVLFAAWM